VLEGVVARWEIREWKEALQSPPNLDRPAAETPNPGSAIDRPHLARSVASPAVSRE